MLGSTKTLPCTNLIIHKLCSSHRQHRFSDCPTSWWCPCYASHLQVLASNQYCYSHHATTLLILYGLFLNGQLVLLLFPEGAEYFFFQWETISNRKKKYSAPSGNSRDRKSTRL